MLVALRCDNFDIIVPSRYGRPIVENIDKIVTDDIEGDVLPKIHMLSFRVLLV